MKANIHPVYGEVLFRCASCKSEWVGQSTKLDGREVEVEGVKMHLIHLEICSNCHPFYSGKKTFVDSAGRVEKFNKRFGSGTVVSKKKQKEGTPASGE
ncbi:50S ribosomal protein L31 [Candidatus Poribacteria bacterium]|nr:50S ribosomal protein L31 [Candidatus Poribacteria bacterium]